MNKYLVKYKDGNRKRQLTFSASSRGMAMIGLLFKGIEMANVITLNKTKICKRK